MTYFVISCGEDGIWIERLSEGDLLERLQPDDDGDSFYGADPLFLNATDGIENGHLPYCMADRAPILIIRGDVIVPEPVSVVQRWKLP